MRAQRDATDFVIILFNAVLAQAGTHARLSRLAGFDSSFPANTMEAMKNGPHEDDGNW